MFFARLLLNFGAVDYEATVLVNGTKVGTHKGGYDAFSFDITEALKAGENTLVVSVLDAQRGLATLGRNQRKKVSSQFGRIRSLFANVLLFTTRARIP